MHRVLERQFRRHLGGLDFLNLTSDWKKLINAINETYVHFDEDRAMLNRSLDLISKEHQQLYQEIKSEIFTKESEIAALKEHIIDLEKKIGEKSDQGQKDVV